MLKLEKRTDLDALHSGLMKESLTLEYKSSGAVDKAQTKKEEMAKDALAFANAAGGQIVYGMKEKDNIPQGLDGGIDPLQFPGVWFEQVIQQNVSPQIEGLRVHEVPLDDAMGRVAVVVTIPAAQAHAPHQAKDGRYYRRHNFRNQIMEDYEVRDLMRRAVDPALEIYFESENKIGNYYIIDFEVNNEMSKPIPILTIVRNKSNRPSMYTVISVFMYRRVTITNTNGFENVGMVHLSPGDERFHLRKKIGVRGSYPIFREAPLMLGPFHFSICHRLLAYPLQLQIGYEIRAPGCFKENRGTIDIDQGGRMALRIPPN
jgi:hypothetical protein